MRQQQHALRAQALGLAPGPDAAGVAAEAEKSLYERLGGVFAIGLIAVVPTGFGNIFDLGAEIRLAVRQSDLLRPPVEFQPGWHAVVGWIMGAVGFTAAWLAVEVGRPAFGVLVTLPVVGLGAISLPEDQQLATGLIALVLFIVALMPFLDGYYGGDMDALIKDGAIASIWTSWIANLMIAQWWLDRKPKRNKRTPATKVAVAA